MKRSPGSRNTPSPISTSTSRRLNAYALAASAAGVGTLALAPPAEAKIIYTPTHVVIGRNRFHQLDLNHDGVADFRIANYYRTTQNVFIGAFLDARGEAKGEAVAGKTFNHSTSYVYAFRRESKIGPSRRFSGYNMLYITGYRSILGKWKNVKARYLGLRFQIKGKTHYGWARLNVWWVNGNGPGITATLTGYAYETIPGKPIIAGQTKGSGTARPATLGELALGRK